MIVKASGGSPLVQPKLYRTASMTAIMQAEQQDRFLQLGELNDLVTFLNSGNKRLEIASILAKNSNFLVSKAADKIFVGGSPISYLEKSQASLLEIDINVDIVSEDSSIDISNNLLNNISSNLFNSGDTLPPGFKPINVLRYGKVRMQKSLRDLDWFLRYLTYAIVAGDSNILSVNIRGLRELIDNACSSAAATVALREMRKLALLLFENDFKSQSLVQEYFNVVIYEFDASRLSDKLRKRFSTDLQGLKLPQVYSLAGPSLQKFVMKSSLSVDEKNLVIKACYRQVFERDISKAYSLKFTYLESQVNTGQISLKEFIRALAKSTIYRKQFYEPFVNSRVIELAFKHLMGRGISSLKEFQKYFAVVSSRGLEGLVDSLINSLEYSDYFGEETVPYLRSLGQEAQESRSWGIQISLLNYSAVFRKIPQFITLFSDYKSNLPDQHPYGIGNDPLSIQFGAIFPQNLVNLRTKSTLFGKDTRRILLRFGPGIYSQISNPEVRAKMAGSLGPKVFIHNKSNIVEKNSSILNIDQVIKAVYLKVFGRIVYEEEFSKIDKFEGKFRNNNLSVRGFISSLVKSSLFRSLYWEPLYICKAIEYIHNKLIGRPTYGRQEINQYFDTVYKKGYYAMIDQMLNSQEYLETFGENIVPYERYLTSSTLSARSLNSQLDLVNKKLIKSMKNITFLSLSKINDKRSFININQRIKQGVSPQRDQMKVFKINSITSNNDRYQILRAIYRQVFERDLNTFTIGDEFYNLEQAFMVNAISIQELLEKIGHSKLYAKEFYQPYPNTKVIELGTKHFLGRAPNNQAEIRYYNQILASQGLKYFVSTLVNSKEYNLIFGKDVVPYHRFPTLPAANFPNTEKLYNTFLKQNSSIVIPSFMPSSGNQ